MTKWLRRRRGAAGALALGAAALLFASPAEAGGTLFWAEAVTQIGEEGVAVGQAIGTLIVLVFAVIIGFALQSMIPVAVGALASGAFAANAEDISTTLFGGGGGGASVLGVDLGHAAGLVLNANPAQGVILVGASALLVLAYRRRAARAAVPAVVAAS